MNYRPSFKPLAAWPEAFTLNRVQSQFKATYSRTMEDLQSELRAVNAHNVCIYLDVKESQIRLDGLLRADAQPGHPGVMLSFTFFGQPDQPVTLHCDNYTHWHHNLRAIAKTLEALRAVERWGVIKRGEQYAGIKLAKMSAPTSVAPLARVSAVPSGSFGSVSEAVKYLAFVAEAATWTVDVSNPEAVEAAICMARGSVNSPAQGRLVEEAISLISGR